MRFNINHCNVRFLNLVVESWYHIVLRTYNLQKDIPRSKCFPLFLFPFGDTACIHERWHRGHQYRWPAKSTMKAWYMSQLKSTHTLEAENRPRAFVRSSDCTEADFWVFDTTLVTVVNERDMKIVIRHDGVTARGKWPKVWSKAVTTRQSLSTAVSGKNEQSRDRGIIAKPGLCLLPLRSITYFRLADYGWLCFNFSTHILSSC